MYPSEDTRDRPRLLRLLDKNEYRDAKLSANRKYEWLEEISECFRLAKNAPSERKQVTHMLVRHLRELGGLASDQLAL